MLEGCTPFPPEFAQRYRERGYWRGQTLWEAFDQSVKAHPDREALVAGNLRFTYRQLGERIDQVAVRLLDLGVKPLDRVLLQLPNIPEFLLMYYALARFGAISVTCLPPHRRTEIAYLAKLSGAVAYAIPDLIRGFDYRDLAREVQEAAPDVKTVLVAGEPKQGQISFSELLRDPLPKEQLEARLAAYRPNPGEPGVFLLSGGTTGLPKLIPRTHDDYVYNARESGRIAGFNPNTVFLAATPIAHNFTLSSPGAQGAFLHGGKVVLAANTEPEFLFRLIQNERVTYVGAVPAMAISWLHSPALAKYDLSSLETIITGGSKFNPEPAKLVQPKLGCRLQQVLGMAEGLLCYTRLDDPDEVAVETVGRPMSDADEVLVVDDLGKPVPVGEPGELWTRGPYTIRGYYRAEQHNAVAFSPDGFYKTGDVVVMRPDGNLVVEGRKKDMINRGGEKISAEEVENLILGHPAVDLAAVVAMPDAVMGEKACAYVTLKPGASLTLPELAEYLAKQQIAKFKLPERLEILDRLPLTSVGKISKNELRSDIERRLRAEDQLQAR